MVSSSRKFLPVGRGPLHFCARASSLFSILQTPRHAGNPLHALLMMESTILVKVMMLPQRCSHCADEIEIVATNADGEADNSDLLAPNDGHKEGQTDPGEGPLRPSCGDEGQDDDPGEGLLLPSLGDLGQSDSSNTYLLLTAGDDGKSTCTCSLRRTTLSKSERMQYDEEVWKEVVCLQNQLPLPWHKDAESIIILPAKDNLCSGDVFSFFFVTCSETHAYDNPPVLRAIILLALPRVNPRVKKKSSLLMCIFIDLPFHPGEHTMNFIGANKCDDHANDQPTDDAFTDVNSPDGEQDNCASKAAADSDGALSDEAVTSDADKHKDDDQGGSSTTADDREAADAYATDAAIIVCFYVDALIILLSPPKAGFHNACFPLRLRGRNGGQAHEKLQMQQTVLMHLSKMKTKVFMMLIINAVLDPG